MINVTLKTPNEAAFVGDVKLWPAQRNPVRNRDGVEA